MSLALFGSLALAQTTTEQADSQTEQQTQAETTGAATALDVGRLLTDPLVDGERVEDPVWTLEPGAGRSLLLLPLRITPGAQPTELSRPKVNVSGGRFLAWHVPGRALDAQGGRFGPAGQTGRGGDDFYDDFDPGPRFVAPNQRFAHLLGDPNADPTGGALGGNDIAEPAELGPRLARRITVTPQRTVVWELDRAIPNATVGSGDGLYALRLDPQRLQELAPERPERLTRNTNETSREFNARRRAAQAELRAEQDEYRQTSAAVRELPDRFEEPLPQVVWAVFELREGLSTLSFTGPDPLPWTVPAESFDAMRGLAGAGRGGGDDAAAIGALERAVETKHPLSLRAVASALAGSDLLARAQPGDPVTRLVEGLLDGGDSEAARLTVSALAAVNPPTTATGRLLDMAARGDDPLAKLAALQATLRGEVANPADVARVVQQTDAVLADPDGPPPAYVLAGLIETTANQELTRQALVAGVRFENLPPDRRAEAIRFVAAHAQDPDGLAAGWLDGALLGSTSPQVVKQTLEVLADADSGPSSLAPFARALRSAVFGGDGSASAEPTPTQNADHPPIENLALVSGSHSLFTALQSGDPATRDLAWRALQRFTLTESRSRRNTDDTNDPLSAILRAATAQPSTPPSLVTFLERQTQGPGTTQALMTLAAEGQGRIASRAVRALLKPQVDPSGRGSRYRDFDSPMRQLTPEQRSGFVAAVYTHTTNDTAPVAGLAQDDRAASWFARQLAQQGGVPEPGDWVEALGGETRAIDLAGEADEAVAHGALAALAASAGADTLGQLEVIDRLGAAPRDADDLQTRWPDVKQSIRVARLEDAAGDYRLVVQITEGPPDQEADPRFGGSGMGGMGMGVGMGAMPEDTAAADPNQPLKPLRTVLGIVELTVANDSVRLVGDPINLAVPDEFLGLRIEDPLQLRNFPTDDLRDVPLDAADAPLDLRRQDNGTWRGQTPIGGTHTLTVTMEPA